MSSFADDIALLSESSECMSSCVDDLNKTCLPYNLHISVGKTKVMHVGKSPDVCNCGLGIEGKEFETVDKFCYLGSMVASDGSISEEIKRRIGISLASFQSLECSLWKRK